MWTSAYAGSQLHEYKRDINGHKFVSLKGWLTNQWPHPITVRLYTGVHGIGLSCIVHFSALRDSIQLNQLI